MQKVIDRAMEIWKLYVESDTRRHGKEWDRSEYVRGFVADVGALVKLTMAKDGLRGVENVDEKLEHELADCLWSIIIIADKYGVDLEEAFYRTMGVLEERAEKDELADSHSL